MKTDERTEAGLKRGVDESRSEYALRDRPRALKFAQERYVRFSLVLYSAIEWAMR